MQTSKESSHSHCIEIVLVKFQIMKWHSSLEIWYRRKNVAKNIFKLGTVTNESNHDIDLHWMPTIYFPFQTERSYQTSMHILSVIQFPKIHLIKKFVQTWWIDYSITTLPSNIFLVLYKVLYQLSDSIGNTRHWNLQIWMFS